MTKTITIQGVSATITAPYAEGHACTAAEASALNQVRAENIRNNKAKEVKELKEQFGEDEAALTAAVAEIVAAYDEAYEFTLASVGGGRSSMSPIEKEARSIARELISGQLREKGITQKDYLAQNGEDAIKEKIALFAQHEKIIAMATKAVAAREANSKVAADLQL